MDSVEDMFTVMNEVAPEHLEIAMDNAYDYLEKVENAGSVFLGHFTSEPIGDYYAGANHVLPTTATSRFSSALGVHDFVKRIQYTQYDKAAVNKAQHDITTLAYAEACRPTPRQLKSETTIIERVEEEVMRQAEIERNTFETKIKVKPQLGCSRTSRYSNRCRIF